MALSDSAGHFTTLSRNVTTGGNGLQLYVALPSSEGATVNYTDTFQANFSQSLVDGLSSNEATTVFTINIDDELQPTNEYAFVSDVSSNEHAIQYSLPNLFDGIPDHQHIIRINYQRTNQPAMVATRTVLAAANDDSDGDGIPDEWENRMGLDPTNAVDASTDNDSDGYSNLEEYIANTHPLNSNEFLFIETMLSSTTNVGFSFQAQSNRNYFVWYADTIAATAWQWQSATSEADPIEGEGQPYQFSDDLTATTRIYRIQVKTPE